MLVEDDHKYTTHGLLRPLVIWTEFNIRRLALQFSIRLSVDYINGVVGFNL